MAQLVRASVWWLLKLIQVRVRIPDQEKFFSVFSESADDSNNFQIVQICARATSSGQNSQWMTLKGLYLYRWGLETEDSRSIWANPLKMHGGSCGGYLVFRVAHETLGRLGIWEWDAVKKRSILVIQGGLNVSHCSKTRSSNIETYGRIDNGSTTVRPHVTWNTHTHTHSGYTFCSQSKVM